jgi:hypothetical protein
MSTASLTQRVLLLVSALNRRGIRGTRAKTILRRHAQQQIAQQIDFYDHEIVFRAKLPAWAATPWLAHRIRNDSPPPGGYLESSQCLSEQLRLIPYRQSRRNAD